MKKKTESEAYLEPLLVSMTDKDAGRILLCIGLAKTMIMETSRNVSNLQELNMLEEDLKKSIGFAVQARNAARKADSDFTWRDLYDTSSIRSSEPFSDTGNSDVRVSAGAKKAE